MKLNKKYKDRLFCLLFGNEESNTTLSEINRILNKCSEDLLNYIYVLGNYNHKMEKS